MKTQAAIKAFFRSFSHARQGIAYTVRTQRNFRFHITAAVWVLLFSLFYNLSRAEYAVLLLTISSVISLEAVNTAVEKTVDLCTRDKKPLAKIAKDAAAGAVLIASAFAVGIGFCLFWDTAVFAKIAEFFIKDPIIIITAAAGAVISFIFVFGMPDGKRK